MTDVTRIITAIEQGDARAADKLLPLVYEELRRLAAHKMSQEKPGQTLQATALVHEAYLRLVGSEIQDWRGRTHFLSAAAEAMRRILVDHARAHRAAKRGQGAVKVSLHEGDAAEEPCIEILELNEALERLHRQDSRPSRVIELHYFGGLSYREIAEVMDVSEATVDRDMRFARAWLLRELGTGR